MDKSDFVLAAMAPAGNHGFSRVQMQKALFLLDANISDLTDGPHFEFRPHVFGPFDADVYDELESLAERDLVKESAVLGLSDPPYSLTEEGLRRGREAFLGLDEYAQDYFKQVVAFVQPLTFSELVQAVYRTYPHMTKSEAVGSQPSSIRPTADSEGAKGVRTRQLWRLGRLAPWRSGLFVGLLLLVLVGVLVAIASTFWDLWPGQTDLKSRSELARNLALVVGGGIALALAAWRSKVAQDQVEISERDQHDLRFHNAVSLLSHEDVVGRLAGIRILGQLAETDPLTFRDLAVNVLCAFVRGLTVVDEPNEDRQVPLRDGQPQPDQRAAKNVKRRSELEAAVRIVSNCNSAAKTDAASRPLAIDLTGIALHQANFAGLDLSKAVLQDAQLPGANFAHANLSGADLRFIDLRRTNMEQADLHGANMTVADLRGAHLNRANFSEARLLLARLNGATMCYADFSGATLSDPDGERNAASGLTQDIVARMRMWAEDDNPPKLDGVKDAETGKPIK